MVCFSGSSGVSNWRLSKETKEEAAKISKLLWPTAISIMLQQFLFFVSLTFCGRINEGSSLELDAAGLSLSIINISGVTTVVGLGAAIDTLAAQAWGAGNKKEVGIYLQRGILILSFTMIPVYAMWLNLGPILTSLHQPPAVVVLTVQYMEIFSFSLPPLFLYFLLQKYLQVQHIIYPSIITGVLANIVNIVAHYVFIVVAKWGIRGAAAATTLSMYTLALSLVAIIYIRGLHCATWRGWSRECLTNWLHFVKLGLPSLVMLGIEEWSFDIGLVVSGYVHDGEIQTGIYSILNTYNSMVWMVSLSLSIAVSIRIGNELGAGNPQGARRALTVGLYFAVAWLVLVESFTLSLVDYIPTLFTSNQALLNLMPLPMLALMVLLLADQLQGFLAGALRGAGRQTLGAVSNFGSYWLFGVPLGIVLAIIEDMGALGYWIGLVGATFVQLGLYAVVVFYTSWEDQAHRIHKAASLSVSTKSVAPVAVCTAWPLRKNPGSYQELAQLAAHTKSHQ